MRGRAVFSLLVALMAGVAGIAGAGDDKPTDNKRIVDRIIEKRNGVEAAIPDLDRRPLEKAESLIRLGMLDEARAILNQLEFDLDENRIEAALLLADLQLRLYDFNGAAESVRIAEEIDPEDDGVFAHQMAIMNAREDLATIDKLTKERLRDRPGSVAGRLARGSLLYQLLRHDESEVEYEEALALAKKPDQGVRALTGLLLIAYKRGDYDGALAIGERAIEAGFPTPGLINSIAQTMIRTGDVGEAIELCHESLRWDPLNEFAHYMLGNGYAEQNYTELEADYPGAFPDSLTEPYLIEAKRLLAEGKRGPARATLINLKRDEPGLADPDLLLGTMFWEEGEPDSAIAHFNASLEVCPGYGRAHNAFAKAMEWKKLRANVHRQVYEKTFAETAMPEIPRIEEFVLNFDGLSDRHKKRVALSIDPWKRFLPVLIEAGATYYIKPLFERLSETPHQELLADMRIDYDSRLWDDVRGCGGFHTVTGVEDVERTVFMKYNTVLHEMTHQVHYVLTPDEQRIIQDHYRNAKEQEGNGQKTFVSRYQGSSVWEYFAEGINSYFSPKRDEYDTREIVRERLIEFDSGLLGMLDQFLVDGSIEKYYAPAYVVAAYDEVENGDADKAVTLLEKALGRSPDDESALSSLARTYSILDRDDDAVRSGERATEVHESASQTWVHYSQAVFHKTGSRADAIRLLLKARQSVDKNQRWEIELALGSAYAARGELRNARDAYEWVLSYQNDNPEALWGLAYTLGFNGARERADELFQKVVRRRSGIVELRTDYARFLIREGRYDEAEKQLGEARGLDPVSTDVETAAGLLALYQGDPEGAKRSLESARLYADYNDLATALLANSLVRLGDLEGAETLLDPIRESMERGDPPTWVYVKKKADFIPAHEYPAELRWILYQTASKLAEAQGDEIKAKEYAFLMEQSFR